MAVAIITFYMGYYYRIFNAPTNVTTKNCDIQLVLKNRFRIQHIITLLLSTFPGFYVTWHHFLYHEIDIGSLSSLQTYRLKSIQEFNSRRSNTKTYYFFIPCYSWTLTISCPFFIFVVYRDCKSLLYSREISTKQ